MECVSPAKALAFNGRRLLERSLGFERDLSLTQRSRSEFFQKSLASMIFLVDELNDAILRITLEQLFSSMGKNMPSHGGTSNHFPMIFLTINPSPLGVGLVRKPPFSGHGLIPFPGLSLHRERGRVQGSIAATLGSKSLVLEDTLKDLWCSTCFGPWWQRRCLQCA